MKIYCHNPSTLPRVIQEATKYTAYSLSKDYLILLFLLDLFNYGLAMFIDDVHDFGKVDRIHHYMVGMLFMLASVGGLKYIVDFIVEDLKKYFSNGDKYRCRK